MADEGRQQGGHRGKAGLGALPVFQGRPAEPLDTQQPELSPRGLLQREALSSLGERPTESLLPPKVQNSFLTDTGSVRKNHFLPFIAGGWEKKSTANNPLHRKTYSWPRSNQKRSLIAFWKGERFKGDHFLSDYSITFSDAVHSVSWRSARARKKRWLF